MALELRFTYRGEWVREWLGLPDSPFVVIGQRLADEVDESRQMQTTPNRYGPITVEPTDEGCIVAAHGPFAHIDEWGSATVGPNATMRVAAERFGKFVEG